MITLRFDERSSEWMKDIPEYNIGFVQHIFHDLELMMEKYKYLYFRDIVRTLGLDPLKYKSTLGWDEKHSDFKYSYTYRITEDDETLDYIDIELNPFDLSSDSENKDYISRQAAIDKMQELEDEDIKAYGCSIPEGFDGQRAIRALKSL